MAVRSSIITRGNLRVMVVSDDQAGDDWYKEETDRAGTSYWDDYPAEDRANNAAILSLLRDVALGDATASPGPISE